MTNWSSTRIQKFQIWTNSNWQLFIYKYYKRRVVYKYRHQCYPKFKKKMWMPQSMRLVPMLHQSFIYKLLDILNIVFIMYDSSSMYVSCVLCQLGYSHVSNTMAHCDLGPAWNTGYHTYTGRVKKSGFLQTLLHF